MRNGSQPADSGPAPAIRLVVLDMAGTTVADGGLVEEAFRAAARLGVPDGGPEQARMLDHVRATMGESKISVFRHLFGDEERAQEANRAFESAYHDLIAQGLCKPVPGAAEAVTALREAGVRTVLTTGFSRTTQDRILDALGWRDLADLTLCPAEAGRGRPYPDLALTALLRTGTDDVREMAVVGDTAYDVLSGRRAGASVVAGVLTGAHGEDRLRAAGATHVLASVAELPALTAEGGRPR
ncbi:phosphonatase-like hydrolase [Phaeacidiphilus oryzae]|uniref:phosphonatase-like hydrolase n=1 Tax=Phaeacidiphilus oryzae TaxID=348818 RepID=UPI000566C255|nr:phosphonatase-like hydrolase [Phaeacidiphilus oryzae]